MEMPRVSFLWQECLISIRNGQQANSLQCLITPLCFMHYNTHTVVCLRLLVYLNPTLRPPLRVSHKGLGIRVPASFVGITFSVCVNTWVNSFVYVCVFEGWDKQWKEQGRPVPKVRSECRHDTLPFRRTPAANTHTHTHREWSHCSSSTTNTPCCSCWYLLAKCTSHLFCLKM